MMTRKTVYIVFGATEPSGETLDWIDDTICLSFAQAARRVEFVRNELRPHEDSPRHYFVRTLLVPESEAGNGEPG